jgi:hypothetical protein
MVPVKSSLNTTVSAWDSDGNAIKANRNANVSDKTGFFIDLDLIKLLIKTNP